MRVAVTGSINPSKTGAAATCRIGPLRLRSGQNFCGADTPRSVVPARRCELADRPARVLARAPAAR
jgi:hypothetical protein